MEIEQILVLVGVVVVLLALWFFISWRNIATLNVLVIERWSDLDKALRKRHDVLPLFIERIRVAGFEDEKLVQSLIKMRSETARFKGKTVQRVKMEGDLEEKISATIKAVGQNKDTGFLEMKTELSQLEMRIERMINDYNNVTEKYNKSLKSASLGIWAKILGFKKRERY